MGSFVTSRPKRYAKVAHFCDFGPDAEPQPAVHSRGHAARAHSWGIPHGRNGAFQKRDFTSVPTARQSTAGASSSIQPCRVSNREGGLRTPTPSSVRCQDSQAWKTTGWREKVGGRNECKRSVLRFVGIRQAVLGESPRKTDLRHFQSAASVSRMKSNFRNSITKARSPSIAKAASCGEMPDRAGEDILWKSLKSALTS